MNFERNAKKEWTDMSILPVAEGASTPTQILKYLK